MAATHVALIRGINVGKANRVAMAELRAEVAKLGYRDVRTLLNSGNVIFAAPRASARTVAARIEEVLDQRLGVPARVMVLGATELREVVADNPLVEVATDHSRLLVAVPGDAAEISRLEPLSREKWAPEALALGRHAAYLWCPEGFIGSRVREAADRVLKDGFTTRNWATLLKLHALLS